MNSTEKKASKIAEKLIKALIEWENFPFDPDMILNDAELQLNWIKNITNNQKDEIKSILRFMRCD